MDQSFGSAAPSAHTSPPKRGPARYLVLIPSGGTNIARLFLDSRQLVGEFDAGTEELALMVQGLTPVHGAGGPEWDHALEGHSADERAAAEVYTLDV